MLLEHDGSALFREEKKDKEMGATCGQIKQQLEAYVGQESRLLPHPLNIGRDSVHTIQDEKKTGA